MLKFTHLKCFSICLLLNLTAPAFAQSGQDVLRLSPGDPDRKEILDAARIQSAKDLDIKNPNHVVFTVTELETGAQFCRAKDWALLSATPGKVQNGVWSEIADVCDGADLIGIFLLKKQAGTWQVIRGGSLCTTDAFWVGWPHEEELRGQFPPGLFECFGVRE